MSVEIIGKESQDRCLPPLGKALLVRVFHTFYSQANCLTTLMQNYHCYARRPQVT
jgi:hypothetical protein